MKLLYIAGPYSAPTPDGIAKNIAAARAVAIALWERGYAVFCPHLNSANMEQDCRATYEDFIAGDLLILSRCDAVVLLPGWKDSPGAMREVGRACALDIPYYEWDPATDDFREEEKP